MRLPKNAQSAANDAQAELFDIYDEQLSKIGTATRRETHTNGYWHRTFHCWLTRSEGDKRYVRFQQRQLTKDTNPGSYDITAAGHLLSGETMEDAVRELREELGLSHVEYSDLIHLAQQREQGREETPRGVILDNEVSDIYGLVCDLPLDQFVVQAEEVAGLYEAELEELYALLTGRLSVIEVTGVQWSEEQQRLEPSVRQVRTEQFVGRKPDYYHNVFAGLRKCT